MGRRSIIRAIGSAFRYAHMRYYVLGATLPEVVAAFIKCFRVDYRTVRVGGK